MSTIPDVNSGIRVVEQGYCSLTLISKGQKVLTPWTIPQQPLGAQPFQLHVDVVKQIARALDLVDVKYYEEIVDQRDARIQELEGLLEAQTKEMDALRYAAERFYSSEAAKGAQSRRNKREQRIEKDSKTINDLKERIKELESGVTA